jgi:hypothetical protein
MRRIEIQVQVKEGLERAEQLKKQRIEYVLRQRENEIHEEQRAIKKKEKQARKLEHIEAEILQRLKETH